MSRPSSSVPNGGAEAGGTSLALRSIRVAPSGEERTRQRGQGRQRKNPRRQLHPGRETAQRGRPHL